MYEYRRRTRWADPRDSFPAGEWLLEQARALGVEDAKPKLIIEGRNLIELGFNPGPHFGAILKTYYDAQIEGKFSTLEEGIEYLRTGNFDGGH